MADPNVLVTIPEVARALGINKDHAYRLRKQGKLGLETLEIGSRVYCYRADLERALRGKTAIRALPTTTAPAASDDRAAALAFIDGQIAVLRCQREAIAATAPAAVRSA